MPDRDARIDPRTGDELRGDPWRYRVIWHESGEVSYQLLNKNWGYVATQTVSFVGWRATWRPA